MAKGEGSRKRKGFYVDDGTAKMLLALKDKDKFFDFTKEFFRYSLYSRTPDKYGKFTDGMDEEDEMLVDEMESAMEYADEKAASYSATCKRNAENGAKGGRPPKNKVAEQDDQSEIADADMKEKPAKTARKKTVKAKSSSEEEIDSQMLSTLKEVWQAYKPGDRGTSYKDLIEIKDENGKSVADEIMEIGTEKIKNAIKRYDASLGDKKFRFGPAKFFGKSEYLNWLDDEIGVSNAPIDLEKLERGKQRQESGHKDVDYSSLSQEELESMFLKKNKGGFNYD